MLTILEFIIGVVLMVGAFLFCYMSFHVVEEEKQQKYIPLPWEKDGFIGKLFNKD